MCLDNATNFSDCAVESLMLATGKSWIEMYKEMCDTGIEIKTVFNDPYSLTTILSKNGFKFAGSRKITGMHQVDNKGWDVYDEYTTINEVIEQNIDKELFIAVASHAVYYNNHIFI